MIIDKSFSKSELINIIKTYKIDIDNPGKYRKVELSALLVEKLNSLDDIIPSPNLPFLNIIELKFYLTNINPKKTLSIKMYITLVILSISPERDEEKTPKTSTHQYSFNHFFTVLF